MPNAKQDERHIVCIVRAQPEHRERVKALLLDLIEPARSEAGCLYYDLYQEVSQPDVFRIVDGWLSDEAVAAHTAQPNVPLVVEQLTPLLSSPLEVSLSLRVSDLG